MKRDYAEALQDYLAGVGEAALNRGYELGRQAMALGVGVLEMAAIHHEAMMGLLLGADTSWERARRAEASSYFFVESLSAFEITHRGYQEASLKLRHALEFAAVLAHELKAPVTSIIVSAGMLQEALTPSGEDPVGKLLNNILAAARALKSRADDLTDAVGFQTNSLTIRIEHVDLAALLRGLSQRLEPEVAAAGMKLALDLPGLIPPVEADPDRLEQVVSNLVSNAVKFAQEGGRVDIRARAEDDRVVVEVQDHGKGISLADQQRLFQPRLRLERDRRTPGLGLGLALCRQLVEAHGGRIWVESEPGKGSTFGFSLPLGQVPGRTKKV